MGYCTRVLHYFGFVLLIFPLLIHFNECMLIDDDNLYVIILDVYASM